MNRDIKFRAWIPEGQFDPHAAGQMVYFSLEQLINNATTKSTSAIKDLLDYYPHVIMQFTGLLDKDGKEIYEGDILKDIDNRHVEVKFDSGVFYITKTGPTLAHAILLNSVAECEVIGNIYENPELLT